MFGEETPEVGWMVELGTPDGGRLAAKILEVEDAVVTLDFNHPLAGQDLTFELTLVEVTEGENKTDSGIILP
jgi:FKBP-type peptidyl-prolyl cis-trans isomerase 2